ncbi:MAG: 1-deoxy-D-xylulose-5-phosphate reductoisomerase [Bacteroidetes bacterium]|nr:1-deoxy-D-xylulose-5-phosphate reductoisomerase [Bacteroidota bacterium]
MQKKIIILGCTGSIGSSALQAISRYPEKFLIVAISANTNEHELLTIKKRFNVPAAALSGSIPINNSEIQFSGTNGLLEMIETTSADIVLNGISGAPGLRPSITALESGKNLVLANKETVVMANSLIFDLAEKKNLSIIPVDSEHSAILQLIRFKPDNYLNKIILTASGGPFRNTPKELFSQITPEDAVKHPTWSMGRKISIDSATLANKGLEVIETHMFFNTPPEKIEVLIHPQSIVHSMISTTDGSIYAQLSSTDMKIPIMNALMFPDITENSFHPFDLAGLTLSFEQPDRDKFPMLGFAYQALELKGAYSIAYNAVNEVAVENFISGAIKFTDISTLTSKVLQLDWVAAPVSFDDVFAIDSEIRIKSKEMLKTL